MLDEDGEVFSPRINDLDALDVTQRVNEAIEGDGIDAGG
jgi:hypothetical protein